MRTSHAIRRVRLWVAGGVLAAATLASPGALIEGQAVTTPVAAYVFSPSPIGNRVTVPPSTRVDVTVTARDAHGAAVGGAPVYLSFVQRVGGGTAFVGTTALRPKPQVFHANGSGAVGITYVTPSSPPTTGSDVLKAQNSATQASSTVSGHDQYCYSDMASMSFVPSPVARHGTLGPNATAPVTVTAFLANGQRAAHSTIYLGLLAAAGGGTASVAGTALSRTPHAFTTDANGIVNIVYRAPAQLPPSGTKDRITAADSPTQSCASAGDQYA